jgi:1-acyl-sn-glycerol-3-phosphate acyltransferase
VPGTLTRDQLVSGILEFLGRQDDLLSHDQIRASLEHEIDAAGSSALAELKNQLTADDGWSYYPPCRLVARIHYLLAGHFVRPESHVSGVENLATVGDEPLILCANHLSYADANLIQILLYRAGFDELAGRLTALAGPKIFTSLERRFSSLCFGTIKVPQSTDVSSEEAVLGARDVARAARQAIHAASQRLDVRDALVLFGEGRRSRTAQMQPMLPAVARYLEIQPDVWVLPVGITGTDALFPVGDVRVRPARIHLRIGTPLRAHHLLNVTNQHRQTMMDAIGLMIAELLPPSNRGAYENGGLLADAEQALRRLRTVDC